MPVILHDISETKANLYKGVYGENPTFIGTITSYVMLNDARIQIQDEKADDYYILWDNPKTGVQHQIFINKYGRLDDWPEGFFDIVDDQCCRILRCAMDQVKKERFTKNNNASID